MTDKYDAIVVGGGHNGLVCSALLAQSGKQVLLLEANKRALAVMAEIEEMTTRLAALEDVTGGRVGVMGISLGGYLAPWLLRGGTAHVLEVGGYLTMLLAIALPPVCVACQRIEGIEALALEMAAYSRLRYGMMSPFISAYAQARVLGSKCFRALGGRR